MVVAIGRFGPYIRHDGKFYSIPKEDDPHDVEEARGVELIQAKRKSDAEKLIKDFPENAEVKILNGRWGPYIAVGKKNVKIPKDREPISFTLEECLTLAENAPERKGRFGRFAKKTAAPAAKTVKTKEAKTKPVKQPEVKIKAKAKTKAKAKAKAKTKSVKTKAPLAKVVAKTKAKAKAKVKTAAKKKK